MGEGRGRLAAKCFAPLLNRDCFFGVRRPEAWAVPPRLQNVPRVLAPQRWGSIRLPSSGRGNEYLPGTLPCRSSGSPIFPAVGEERAPPGSAPGVLLLTDPAPDAGGEMWLAQPARGEAPRPPGEAVGRQYLFRATALRERLRFWRTSSRRASETPTDRTSMTLSCAIRDAVGSKR